MKKTHKRYFVALTLSFCLLGACSDNFLEVDPVGLALEDNYYRNAEEAYNGLVAAYDPLGWAGTYVNKTFPLNAVSDDFHCGGGSATDNNHVQVWDKFTVTPVEGPQNELWRKGYSGIFRTNILIEKLPNVDMDENLMKRFVAEAKFLRAYYYFDLIRFFRNIPLILEPLATAEIFTVEQAERAAVFKAIEDDLIAAIADLPPTINKEAEAGRATEGAGRALLGKVYLEQDKFDLAAAQFAEVNGTPGGTSQYGYKLMDNYADLFKLENEFNEESIFEISHNSTSNQGWDGYGSTEGNVLAILVAPRSYVIKDKDAGAPTFVSGWSFNTVTESLVNAFVQGGVYDPRYTATIANIDSLEQAGVVSYEHAFENTGYFLAKFAGREENKSTGTGAMELNFPTNEYEIRLADTYLLEAEAIVRGSGGEGDSRAQALLDAVRARVGLGTVLATFDNIFAERRLELAGEGHRWFDLIRTGKAESVLATKGFIKGKHEYLPIPQSEVDFDKTQIKQDPAYQ